MSELIFKQWSEEDLTFFKQHKLNFAECDKNSKMTWSDILRFTSDGAGEDFTMRNLSWQVLKDNGIVFVVTRTSYHVHKMPVADQLITLKTWEEAPQGPLFARRYEILDTNTNDVLISGYSLWTILDTNSHRMVPSKAFSLRPTPSKVTDFAGIKAGKIGEPEGTTEIGSHKVVFSDMDANGHVNNSKYINFVIDNLPEEYQNRTYTDMRLNYSKEAVYGDTINLFGKIDETEKKITVIGKVGDTISFESELYW